MFICLRFIAILIVLCMFVMAAVSLRFFTLCYVFMSVVLVVRYLSLFVSLLFLMLS